MIHRFGPFQYDSEQRVLFRDAEPAPLAPKAIDTLHVLLDQRGRVVEKSDLIKLVWPDTKVEEIGLARNISILRKALEDEGGSSYIETDPRRGYRFAAAETASPSRTRHKCALAIAAVAALAVLGCFVWWQFYTPSKYLVRVPGAASLAVVPFDCLTPGPESSAFARGLGESLVSELSNLPGMQVLSPSTVRRHQRFGVSMGLMGRLLGLDVLVEGTVEKGGDRIRIAPRLVDVHTGRLIWARNYDYPAADTDHVEDQAAHEIAEQVAAHLASATKH